MASQQENRERVISEDDLERFPELREGKVRVGDTILVPVDAADDSIEGWTVKPVEGEEGNESNQ